MSEEINFLNALKIELLKLDKRLDNLLAYYQGDECSFAKLEDLSHDGIEKIATLVKNVSLATKQDELAAIAQVLQEKMQRILAIEDEIDEENSENIFES